MLKQKEQQNWIKMLNNHVYFKHDKLAYKVWQIYRKKLLFRKRSSK